jgi:hypothetical protein
MDMHTTIVNSVHTTLTFIITKLEILSFTRHHKESPTLTTRTTTNLLQFTGTNRTQTFQGTP